MIDIKTVSLCIALINIFLCISLFVAWRVQKVYSGFGFWVFANIGLALGYVSLAFLRESTSFLIAIAMSNTFFALAAWLRLEGLHRFLGEKRRWYPHFIFIALVIFVLGCFADDMAMRTIVITGVLAYYLFKMTWVVTSHARGEIRVLYRYLASIFLLYALLLASRTITTLIAPSQIILPAATMANILFFPAVMLLDIGVTFAFLMMNDRRLSMELGEAEERLRLTLEATNDGVWDWNIQTGKTIFSPQYYRMLGFEPYEFTESYDSWRSLVHPDDVDRAEGEINERIKKNSGYAIELRMRAKSGDWCWILTRGMVVERDTENLPVRIVGTHSDITDRKQAEEDLRILNDRHELAVRSAGIGIWDWDIRQNRLVWDDQMYNLYGIRKEDFTGAYEAWIKGLHPDDAIRSGEASEKARIGEMPYDTEFRIIRPNGELHHLKASGHVHRDEHGEPIRMIGVNYDITERKRAEEKNEASLREKETLLKEIHHRVKNNLQIISSLLSLQSGYIEDDKMEGIFRECQDRIMAMASVHALLYKSQNFAEINFGEYVKETASQLFRSYKTGNAAISLVIHAENIMLPINTAIPCGLIINELVTNALKYAFPGVGKGEIKVEMNQTEKGVRLLFEDNGIGFPAEVDSSKMETLGLKLVHLLVKQLDGSIEQDTNNGTSYVIMFKTETPQEI